MKYEELNLEAGHPTVSEAMENLKTAVKGYKNRKTECVLIIHGYGSSGSGGAIRENARKWLKAQVKNGVLKAVISGEDFSIFDSKALELINKYPELKKYIDKGNHGVTVVEI